MFRTSGLTGKGSGLGLGGARVPLKMDPLDPLNPLDSLGLSILSFLSKLTSPEMGPWTRGTQVPLGLDPHELDLTSLGVFTGIGRSGGLGLCGAQVPLGIDPLEVDFGVDLVDLILLV